MLRAGGRLCRRCGSRSAAAGPGPGPGTGDGSGDGSGDGCGAAALPLREDAALLRASSAEVRERLRGLAVVRGRFVSAAEEAALLRELRPRLERGAYRGEHWDGVTPPPQAICGYRETELALRGGEGRALLLRVTAAAFPPPRAPAPPLAHVLDLLPSGHVRAHVDSVKFCGCTIAGVSLLSPCVLRLVCCRSPQHRLELLLEPRSLYVLRGAARYEFTHEILPDAQSWFGGRRVPRGRRISIIYRNAPPGRRRPPGGRGGSRGRRARRGPPATAPSRGWRAALRRSPPRSSGRRWSRPRGTRAPGPARARGRSEVRTARGGRRRGGRRYSL
ncbi:LOW QUALITY PROTEIN: alpha-ketoglutarate-dependent dioxygenase alkB homolog 7, mitochondrial [Ara ararauna]